MKHHISLVGGQILPLYLGIVESDADYIHFIYSKDSSENVKNLKNLFKNKHIKYYECNAFNYKEIVDLYSSILKSYNDSDFFIFNITGGTKLMTLAATEFLIKEKSIAFYFNQDLTYYVIPSYELKNISKNLEITDYIELSGNKIASYTDIRNYDNSAFRSALMINNFSNSNFKEYSAILKFIDQKFKSAQSIPSRGNYEINSNLFINWDENGVDIETASGLLLELSCKDITSVFFNAGWWELLVAEAVNRWVHKYELFTNVILPYKNNNLESKNEIDVLVNTGKRLIFIECKSGNINTSDINKIKTVREIYGGRIAKSLLVSKFKPSDRIIEKCQELDIEFFYCYENTKKKVNELSQIISTLNTLVKKSSI